MFMASSVGGDFCRIDVPVLTELLLFAQFAFIALVFLSITSIGLPVVIYISIWWLSYRQIRSNFKYLVLLPILFPLITFIIYAAININWDYVKYKLGVHDEFSTSLVKSV